MFQKLSLNKYAINNINVLVKIMMLMKGLKTAYLVNGLNDFNFEKLVQKEKAINETNVNHYVQ